MVQGWSDLVASAFNQPVTRTARSKDIPVWDAKVNQWIPTAQNKLAYAPAVASWSPFPFAASCANFGGGFQACQYVVDPHGFVHLRGALVFSGTPASPQTLGTLPVNARPLLQEGGFAQIGTYSGGPIAFLVDILSTGLVKVSSASGVTWTGAFLSLSGISFDSGIIP